MDSLILVMSVLIAVTPAFSQIWPKTGSCSPCQCAVQKREHSYGLLKYINCSSRGLAKIPENLPSDVDFLDLSHNQIAMSSLKTVCNTFSSLQFLRLLHNGINSFDSSPFAQCSLLVQLDLNGNTITHLRNSSFEGLNNLKAMYGLKADSAEVGIFSRLDKLKMLEFTFSGQDIPEMLFINLPVETLNLTLTKVVNIPERLLEFGEKTLQVLSIDASEVTNLYENLLRGLTVLRTVHLDMPSLSSLPERLFRNFGISMIGDPRNLQEIVLRSINTLPNTLLSGLESLHRLEIHDVHEIRVNGIFDDLMNLEVLDLTESNVVHIPSKWFSKLYSLKTLNLSRTNLRSIESNSLNGLTNLRVLDMSMNAVRFIPEETLDPLRKSIQKLLLRGNMLKVVDNTLLRDMLALEHLDLSDNKLNSIHKDAFINLRLLNHLQLQENKLSFLPINLFGRQLNLQVLDLGTNYFRRIPLSLLKSAGFLLRLNVPNNNIPTVPTTLHDDLPYLEYLSLKNNPLQCRCRLLSLRLYKPNLEIDGVCVAPRAFFKQHVMSFAVPENCPGPRPISTEGQAPATSFLPVPFGLNDYEYGQSYYYYGNYWSHEYYEFETDHYYYELESVKEKQDSTGEYSTVVATKQYYGTRSGSSKYMISPTSATHGKTIVLVSTTPVIESTTCSQVYSMESTVHLQTSSSEAGENEQNSSFQKPTEPLSRTFFFMNETDTIIVTTSAKQQYTQDTGKTSSAFILTESQACETLTTLFTETTHEGMFATSSTEDTPLSLTPKSSEDVEVKKTEQQVESDETSLTSISSNIIPELSSSEVQDDKTVTVTKPTVIEAHDSTTLGDVGIALLSVFAVLAVIGIALLSWWFTKQTQRRRLYEVTPQGAVV